MMEGETYEWFCTACGVTTYVPREGGNLGCMCKWEPPLERWENSERTREHARQQMVFRIYDGHREYLGTAADLEGARG
jgi:hypothetical protein